MNVLTNYLRELATTAERGWHAFWFTPSDAATLGLIRILTGTMLFYTHLVWSLDLEAFFGGHAWLNKDALAAFHRPQGFAWSYFNHIESRELLWAAHIAALVVFALLTLGLFSRVVSVLAYLIAVSYVNRVPAALFGLDQINVLLAMYLMIGPSGDCYSLDRWLAARRAGRKLPPASPKVSANVAIRLIQCHMCVIYLFAGLSKLGGESWWNGLALWLSFANLEYQSIDMTWTANWPLMVSLMTHISIMWEVSYCVLVWPRLTRPLVVALAVPLHLGIAFCLGMITFGLIMLVANLAFVSPTLVRAAVNWITRSSEAFEEPSDFKASSDSRGRRKAAAVPAVKSS